LFSGAVPEPSRAAWHAARKIVPFSRKSAFVTATASSIRRPRPRISQTQMPADAMLPQPARLDRLIERPRDDHADDPARRHAQPRHRDREQVQHRVPVIGCPGERAPAEHGPDVLVAGAQAAVPRPLVDLKPRHERFRSRTETRPPRLHIAGERLVTRALVHRQLELRILGQLPPAPVDRAPVADLVLERAFPLLAVRPVAQRPCMQHRSMSVHVRWHVPAAHALSESGLWPAMPHFLKTTPVRLSASAMVTLPDFTMKAARG
jgi:hypothetical protein